MCVVARSILAYLEEVDVIFRRAGRVGLPVSCVGWWGLRKQVYVGPARGILETIDLPYLLKYLHIQTV